MDGQSLMPNPSDHRGHGAEKSKSKTDFCSLVCYKFAFVKNEKEPCAFHSADLSLLIPECLTPRCCARLSGACCATGLSQCSDALPFNSPLEMMLILL